MREGWEIKKLGEIGTIVGGSTPKTNNPAYWGEGHPWITPAELNGSKFVSETERAITDEAIKHTNLTLLPAGTVLLSSRAPIGKVAIASIPLYCNQGFKNIICDPGINNEYVYWFLIHRKDYLISLGRGATFKEISKSIVEKVSIPVPPIQEQEQIVAELDCLRGIIEKKKQQLKELDNLAQSIFYDMFGDPYEQSQYGIKPLDTYCKIVGRIGFRGYTRNDFVETPQEGAISLSPSNIINGEMDYSKCSYITWFKYEESPEIKVYNGDILVVKTGSSYGKVALVKDLPHKASINPQFVVLKEVQCNRYFLEYYLKTPFARDKYEEFVIGTAIPTFSQKKLGTLPIVDVPIDLQTTFAHKIEAIEHQKSLIKQSIQETETLFNSRMDYWFN